MPKGQLSHYKLHQGDEFRWMEHSTSPSHKSTGWIITKQALEAQSSKEGTQQLWVPKLKLQAYKVPSFHQQNQVPQPPKVQKAQRKSNKKRKKYWRPMQKQYIEVSSLQWTYRWIPKSLLQRQGYYKGNTKI